jgi:glycosyltransferase involved in cell wall biosynthesis
MSEPADRPHLDLALDNRSVSVIIPSWEGEANPNLARLLEEIEAQSLVPIEVRVVARTSPNGHARNVGASQTSGSILVFLDDDISLGSPDIFQSFVDHLLDHADLGMAGTSQQLPPKSSAFQRRCGSQLSRGQSDIVKALTPSDMVTTQCCAVRRSVLEQIGGFNDKIIRGVDPELRYRMRKAGYVVAVIPNAWHYHPMPASLRALVRMAWRDGAASAFARKHYPETVLFSPDGHTDAFQARRPLPLRVWRNLVQLMSDALRGKWCGLAYGIAYATGNLAASARAR